MPVVQIRTERQVNPPQMSQHPDCSTQGTDDVRQGPACGTHTHTHTRARARMLHVPDDCGLLRQQKDCRHGVQMGARVRMAVHRSVPVLDALPAPVCTAQIE